MRRAQVESERGSQSLLGKANDMETSESSPLGESGSSVTEGFPTEAFPSSWAKGPALL